MDRGGGAAATDLPGFFFFFKRLQHLCVLSASPVWNHDAEINQSKFTQGSTPAHTHHNVYLPAQKHMYLCIKKSPPLNIIKFSFCFCFFLGGGLTRLYFEFSEMWHMHTSCILFPVEVDNLSINISMRGGGATAAPRSSQG